MKSQPSSSFPLKLTSPFGEKNVCIRIFGLATLMPDWPPSPKMVTDQFLPFVVACVPLSCVPPWTSFGLLALEDRLWNWSVESPSFSDVIVFGVFDSQLWQSVRSAPVSPRPRALRGGVDERAVEPPDAAVVPDEDDIGAERHAGDRVLVGVQADALGVDRHVGEVRRVVLRALDRAAVRAERDRVTAEDLVVLHRAADVDHVREPGRRVHGHVVRALPDAVVERAEARRAVGRVGLLRPTRSSAGQERCRRRSSRVGDRVEVGGRAVAGVPDVDSEVRTVRSKRELRPRGRRGPDCPRHRQRRRSGKSSPPAWARNRGRGRNRTPRRRRRRKPCRSGRSRCRPGRSRRRSPRSGR